MSNSGKQQRLRRDIEKWARCPVDWGSVVGYQEHSLWPLLFEWYLTYCEHGVGAEDKDIVWEFAAWENDVLMLDLEGDSQATLKNLKSRFPKAKDDYRNRIGRLERISFLKPSQHKKHFSHGLSKNKVILKTRSGPSLFFKNYCPNILKQAFWNWFLEYFSFSSEHEREEAEAILEGNNTIDPIRTKFWREFRSSHNLRIAFGCLTQVGAVNGALSEFICFDLHLDQGVAHAYPVSRQEAESIMDTPELEYIDDLQ